MAYVPGEDGVGSGGAETEYFAAKSAEECVPVLKRRCNSWFETISSNNYLSKVKRSWLAYYGADTDDIGSGHSITFGGEQGELSRLNVNHFGNIARHMLNMVTANRPAFQARSTNMDYKSLAQTDLANSLLEYYMREKKVERFLKNATEQAIIMGSGYIKLEWNSEIGPADDFIDGNVLRTGDIVCKNISILDVVFDSTKESHEDLDWVITRTWKNKFDLAAKYPEMAEKIKKLQTKSDIYKWNFIRSGYDITVDVPVYEFYHKETEALDDGRYLMFLDQDIVLSDGPMPYKSLPIYRISPGEIIGTPYGYTPMFDLLPVQEAVNSLYSTVLTNQSTFGVQSVAVPRGSDLTSASFEGGMNLMEYNFIPGAPNGGRPESINLTQTPPEIFDFMQLLVNDMETLSGISSVVRGNPEASLESGAALALVQSQALQFMSGLQHSYISLIESVGTGIIEMIQQFASAPRIAAIVGENNKTEMKEFTKADVSGIARVAVDVSNPLSMTHAGRVQIAEQLMQMMPEKLTPESYIAVMNTGRLENMTRSTNDEFMLAKEENRKLVEGKMKPLVIATDSHWLHIKEHKCVIADPDLRYDVGLVERTLAHIQEHLNELRNADPDLLMGLGQQPLGVQQQMQEAGAEMPMEGAPGAGPMESPGGMPPTPDQQAAGQVANPMASMPAIPAPAQSPEGGPSSMADMPLAPPLVQNERTKN